MSGCVNPDEPAHHVEELVVSFNYTLEPGPFGTVIERWGSTGGVFRVTHMTGRGPVHTFDPHT